MKAPFTFGSQPLQGMFDWIVARLLDLPSTNVKIRYGTDTVTFTAAQVSAVTTVSHGLGKTPSVVLLSPFSLFNVVYASHNHDADSFDVTATHWTTLTASGTFAWLALA